jgi:hypothetical protein
MSKAWFLKETKGKLMKSFLTCICRAILAGLLVALVFQLSGCSTEQLGETAAEGRIRHERNLRINNQEMMTDIDKVLLFDKPSKLTDKRIP